METCRNIGGLAFHICRMHKQRRGEEHICGICHRIFKTKSAEINHEKACAKKKYPKSTYPAIRPSEGWKTCERNGTTISKAIGQGIKTGARRSMLEWWQQIPLRTDNATPRPRPMMIVYFWCSYRELFFTRSPRTTQSVLSFCSDRLIVRVGQIDFSNEYYADI